MFYSGLRHIIDHRYPVLRRGSGSEWYRALILRNSSVPPYALNPGAETLCLGSSVEDLLDPFDIVVKKASILH